MICFVFVQDLGFIVCVKLPACLTDKRGSLVKRSRSMQINLCLLKCIQLKHKKTGDAQQGQVLCIYLLFIYYYSSMYLFFSCLKH